MERWNGGTVIVVFMFRINKEINADSIDHNLLRTRAKRFTQANVSF